MRVFKIRVRDVSNQVFIMSVSAKSFEEAVSKCMAKRLFATHPGEYDPDFKYRKRDGLAVERNLDDYVAFDVLQTSKPVFSFRDENVSHAQVFKKPVNDYSVVVADNSEDTPSMVNQKNIPVAAEGQGVSNEDKMMAFAEMDRHKTNHILHVILSIFTLSFWMIVWAFVAASNVKERNIIRKNYGMESESNVMGAILVLFFLLIVSSYSIIFFKS